MNGQERRPRGALSRDRIVAAGLEILERDGLSGLSMRAVADQLDIKAASLYWHVRDRRELIELIGTALVGDVEPGRVGEGWRETLTGLLGRLAGSLERRPWAAELLVEAHEVVDGSPVGQGVREALGEVGLSQDEVAATAALLIGGVLYSRLDAPAAAVAEMGTLGDASVVVDSASIGVTVRAGVAGDALAISVPGADGDVSVAIDGRAVTARRPHAGGGGVVALDPRYRWSVRVAGATSQTRLDLAGLRIVALKIDSGAFGIEAVLPRPEGVVPIDISSGVTNVRLHRPRGSAAAARISGGALRLRLDRRSTLASLTESRWASGDTAETDRYELIVNSGTVDVQLDQRAPSREPETGPGGTPAQPPAADQGRRLDIAAAIELALDGIQARVAATTEPPLS